MLAGFTVLNINARKIFDKLGLSATLVRNGIRPFFRAHLTRDLGYEIEQHIETAGLNDPIREDSFKQLTKNILGKDGKPLLPLVIQTPTLNNVRLQILSKDEI